MKKLVAIILVLAMLFSVAVTAVADEEKALQLTSTASGMADKIDFPWLNMYILGGLMWRTLFFVETDMTTLGPELASGLTAKT